MGNHERTMEATIRARVEHGSRPRLCKAMETKDLEHRALGFGFIS